MDTVIEKAIRATERHRGVKNVGIPLISVIIPVYNVEKYLDRCLESVTNQTYKNLQIIIVESASTDNSGEICDRYSQTDPRIKVIHQSEREGLSNARNIGLGYAEGEYVGFVDSDDIISYDMFEIMYKCIVQENADISCVQVERFHADSIKDYTEHTYDYRIYTKNEFAKKFFKIESNETVHYVWNKLYTKKVANNIYFPDGLLAEDVEGFFRALLVASKIVCIDRVGYYYRYNPEGLSSDWFSKKQMDLIRVWQNVLTCCRENCSNEWVDYAEENYYRSYFGVLTRLLLSGKSDVYLNEKELLIANVKEHYKFLMHSHMPFSRKLLLTVMNINYDFVDKIYKKLFIRESNFK